MKDFPHLGSSRERESFDRTFLWPFIYTPILRILLIHVATRVMWFLGIK